ncbi:MAG: hypothetical protein R3E13_04255 [Alphaproteobacteria bacterium]
MASGLKDTMNIAADPQKAANFLGRYSVQDLGRLGPDELRGVQQVLSHLGFYLASSHEYYADGIDGPFTRRSLEMAQTLFPQAGVPSEDVINSELTIKIRDETIGLINNPNLSSNQILHLQQNLKYLKSIDILDEGESFELDPGKIDGYMGPKTSQAALAFAQKYSVGIGPDSTVGRELRRDGFDVGAHMIEVLPLRDILSANVMGHSRIEDLQEALIVMGFDPGGVDGISGSQTINGVDGEGGLIQALKDAPGLIAFMSKAALRMTLRHSSAENHEWLTNQWAALFPTNEGRMKWLAEIEREPYEQQSAPRVTHNVRQAYASEATNLLRRAAEVAGVVDVDQQAYILATVKHETAHRMEPVREALGSSDEDSRRKIMAFAQRSDVQRNSLNWSQNMQQYAALDPVTNEAYFGRGYVQITWAENYKRLGARLSEGLTNDSRMEAFLRENGVDENRLDVMKNDPSWLYNNPGLALDPAISALVTVVGMKEGLFTGQGLDDYFGPGKRADAHNARDIVNGDSALNGAKIAADYNAFKTLIEQDPVNNRAVTSNVSGVADGPGFAAAPRPPKV